MGGLGLSPPTIGAILSVFGILNGPCQLLFFARIHNRFGTKNVFFAGMLSTLPLFVLFPIMNALAIRAGGVLDIWVWLAIGLQTVLSLGSSFCYGSSSLLLPVLSRAHLDFIYLFRMHIYLYLCIGAESSKLGHCKWDCTSYGVDYPHGWPRAVKLVILSFDTVSVSGRASCLCHSAWDLSCFVGLCCNVAEAGVRVWLSVILCGWCRW
jgi:hypothetical protein